MSQRVLMVCTGLGRGGAETQLLRLARALQRKGHEVRILSLIAHNAWSEEIAEWGLHVEVLGVSKRRIPLRPVARFVDRVRAFRPDVVLSFLFGANTLVQASRPLLRSPRVVSSIRSVIPADGAQPRMMRALSSVADLTVFNSVAVMDDAVARGIYRADRSVVIRNAVDPAPIVAARDAREAVRQEWGVSADDWVWLAVGNVRPVKNYPALVSAFASLAEAHPRAVLRIVGKPYGDVSRMKAVAPELWASGRVAYLGQRTDVPRQLAGADAYVLSSQHEGSPNTVIEAMTAGLPVVATEVGGVTELLDGGARGWPARASTAAAIADAMAALMHAPESARAARVSSAQRYLASVHAPAPVLSEWERVLFG